jgi:hypothetical protein
MFAMHALCGVLIAIELFTPCAAFVASGEMAAACAKQQRPSGTAPILNHGELAVLH